MQMDNVKVSVHGDKISPSNLPHFTDSEVTVVDVEHQMLSVRVGPVFVGDGYVHKTPGIWIWYQERYMMSELSGPVLLSLESWRRFNEYVEKRFHDLEEAENV